MAVTAFPVILVNATGGSDSAASGAGPSTALTGTAGATDGAGTTVTLDSGTDLTNVNTDGSHVLYFVDTTAGHRRFTAINAKAGSGGATPTVTVEQALTISLSGKTWAIGGKRASIGSATSVLLLENNSANGDAVPGWIAELQSGHTETIAATITLRRAGDTTSGKIILRGVAGAGVLPRITFSNNGNAFFCSVARWTLQAFEMQNSNATKTASVAVNLGSGSDYFTVRALKIADGTNKFWKAVNVFANVTGPLTIEANAVQNCASNGIDVNGGTPPLRIKNNIIQSNGGAGILMSVAPSMLMLEGNSIAFNAGAGFNYSGTTAAGTRAVTAAVRGNAFHGNGTDGLLVSSTSAQDAIFAGLLIESNDFTLNGGYGINFSGSGVSDTLLAGDGCTVRTNRFNQNTTNKYNGFTVTTSQDELTDDPSGGLASATKDYAGTTGGTNFMSSVSKAKGYPIGGTLAVGTYGSSYSYVDIGLQHQDSGGVNNRGILTGGRL